MMFEFLILVNYWQTGRNLSMQRGVKATHNFICPVQALLGWIARRLIAQGAVQMWFAGETAVVRLVAVFG
jgi:hypothetical protein